MFTSTALLATLAAPLSDVRFRYVAAALLLVCALYVVFLDVVLRDTHSGDLKDVEGLPTGIMLSRSLMKQSSSGRPRPHALRFSSYPPSGSRPYAHRAALTMLYRHNMPTHKSPPPSPTATPRSRPPSPLSSSFVIAPPPAASSAVGVVA